VGYAPEKPEEAEHGRQQNRRVEIVILNPGAVDAPRAVLQ